MNDDDDLDMRPCCARYERMIAAVKRASARLDASDGDRDVLNEAVESLEGAYSDHMEAALR